MAINQAINGVAFVNQEQADMSGEVRKNSGDVQRSYKGKKIEGVYCNFINKERLHENK